MTIKEFEPEEIGKKIHDLAHAMDRARSAQAEKADVVVDMKHAKIARLELLAQDLAEVINDIPVEAEQFEFAITNGETPRFWIDMTSFVRMGGDGREYEFVKDTRLGRTILGRTTDRTRIGEVITNYLAERLLERERFIEGDWITAKGLANKGAQNMPAADGDEASSSGKSDADAQSKRPQYNVLAWFFAGLAIGLGAILFLVATNRLEPTLDWLRLL